METKNYNLIFLLTVLYYAGSYIAETIPNGQLILVFAIGLMTFAVLSNTGGKIPIKNNGFIIYVFAFLSFCALSTLWAEDPSLSVSKINGVLFVFIGMIVIHFTFMGYTSVDGLLKVIMYGGYIVVLYAYVRYGFGGILRLAADDTRITSDIFNANTIGMCTAYAMVINIFFIFYEHLKIRDILMVPAAVLLIVSQSRKAIIIVVLGIIGIYMLRNLNKKNFGIFLLKLLGGLLLLGAGFWIISKLEFLQAIVKRFSDIFQMLSGEGTRASNSAWIRFAYMELGIDLFKKNPILGIGIGNANIYTKLYYRHSHYLHNNYVELLATGGLIGITIYYSMHLYLILSYMKYRKCRDREYDICLILLIIKLIVDFGLVSYYDKDNYLFLFMIWLKINAVRKQFEALKQGAADGHCQKIDSVT